VLCVSGVQDDGVSVVVVLHQTALGAARPKTPMIAPIVVVVAFVMMMVMIVKT